MVRCVETKVMAVGLNGNSQSLKLLPIQLICSENGMAAIQWLRQHRLIDALVSQWDLPDMKNGELVRRIKRARPWLPTIVLLDEPYQEREITVRGLGVVAVFPSTIAGGVLQQIIVEILGLQKINMASETLASSTNRMDKYVRSS